MRQSRIRFMFAIGWFATGAGAWAGPAGFRELRVSFDQASYQITVGADSLDFQDGSFKLHVHPRACHRPRFTEFLKHFEPRPPREQRAPASAFDVVVEADGRVHREVRGGPVGTWLRNLPRRISYLHAELVAPCSR